MTKTSEAAMRIKRLRESLGETQKQFAERVGVTHPTISAWEKGDEDYAPGPGAYLSLGNQAAKFHSIEDALWFWEQAGQDEKAMLLAAGKVLKAEPGEMVAALLRNLSAKTRWLVVDEKTAGLAFAPGDVILVDETATAGPEDELQPLIGRPALFDFPLRSQRSGNRMGSWKEMQVAEWPEGLCCGRLRLSNISQRDQLTWIATLAPLFHEGDGYVIGYYRHDAPPEDHSLGSEERKKANDEVAKASRRCQELWDKQAKRGGMAIEQTPEMVEAGRIRNETETRRARAKDAEHRAAREEAKQLAPTSVRLFDGRVVGRLIAWFSLSGEKKLAADEEKET